jgi:hypothetical protein
VTYRLYISEDRTILVRIWPDGRVTVSLRESTKHIWGPETPLFEENK